MNGIAPTGAAPSPQPGTPMGTTGTTGTMGTKRRFHVLRPYMLYMQLVGLFFRDAECLEGGEDPEGAHGHQDGACPPKRRFRNFWKVYASVTVALTWVTFLSLLMSTLVLIKKMGFSDLVKMCCITLWSLQNCINATTCYSLCLRNKLYHNFFEKFDTLPVCSLVNLHRSRDMALVAAVLINVINQIGWIILSFEIIPGISTFYFFPVLKFMDSCFGEVLQRSWGLAFVLSTPCWTLPTGLFVIICLSVKKVFQLYNCELRAQLKNCEVDIEPLRLQFQNIVHLVEITDRNFGVYIFMMFLNNLCTLSLIIYRLVFYTDAAMFSRAVDVFWVVSTITILVIISFVCAWVNVVLSLFIKRLCGNPIGFTGCGYFIITKGFILTLVSAFFTYFFLLLQFGNSDPKEPNCLTNESFVLTTSGS